MALKMEFYRLQNENYFNKKMHYWHGRCQWRDAFAQMCYYMCGHIGYVRHDVIHWITATSCDKFLSPMDNFNMDTFLYNGIYIIEDPKINQRSIWINWSWTTAVFGLMPFVTLTVFVHKLVHAICTCMDKVRINLAADTVDSNSHSGHYTGRNTLKTLNI